MPLWPLLLLLFLLLLHATATAALQLPLQLDAMLSELGMRSEPDMTAVNTTREEMRRMVRKYRARVRMEEREVMVFHQKGCHKMNHVTFTPDIPPSSLTSARLRFPDSSHLDVTNAVHQWLRGPASPLTLSCRRRRRGCCRTRLEIAVRPPRSKRSSSLERCDGQCCRKSLKISFKEIGWNWVVQPKEFEAFYCKGRCKDVTSDFASTHALMQSILNNQGRKVPRPCCTPKKLKPLSLLHYNDHTPPELVVTRKKGMIVKECACT